MLCYVSCRDTIIAANPYLSVPMMLNLAQRPDKGRLAIHRDQVNQSSGSYRSTR